VDNNGHEFVILSVCHGHLTSDLIPRRLVYSVLHVCWETVNKSNNKVSSLISFYSSKLFILEEGKILVYRYVLVSW